MIKKSITERRWKYAKIKSINLVDDFEVIKFLGESMRSRYEKPDCPNDIKWMDSEKARIKWECASKRQVRSYCIDNWEQIGAYQRYKRGPWVIPVNACPPLKEPQLREFLINVLKYQNGNQKTLIIDPIIARWSFAACVEVGYAIAPKDVEICEDNLIITDSGWDLIESPNKSKTMGKYIINLFSCSGDLSFSII